MPVTKLKCSLAKIPDDRRQVKIMLNVRWEQELAAANSNIA